MADEKRVIEKAQYASELNEVEAIKKYNFQELMNKFGFPGRRWRYDGSRSIIFPSLTSGKDSPINKQVLVVGGVQDWEMKDEVKTITREREYTGFVDNIYTRTADVSGFELMAAYEAEERPETVSRGISEDLYAEAANHPSGAGIIEVDFASMTSDDAWKTFYDAKERLEGKMKRNSPILFYTLPSYYRRLVDGDMNKRVIMNGSDVIGRSISEIDGVGIRTIRNNDDLMSKYNGTVDKTGMVVADDAVQVVGFMVAKNSIAVPFIIDDVYIDAPNATTKGKWVVANRYAFNAIADPHAGLSVVAIVDTGATGADVNP